MAERQAGGAATGNPANRFHTLHCGAMDGGRGREEGMLTWR
jgi:hypothetical protein